jgi:hypothetical protein
VEPGAGADSSWRPPADRYRGRQLLMDLAMIVLVAALVLWCGFVLWRLDDRSERLLAIAAASRAVAPSCP